MADNQSLVEEKVFRVKSSTAPPDLGSAVAHAVRRGGQVTLKAVGAGAVNQAAKSVPIAQSFVVGFGIELLVKITFFDVETPDGKGDIIGVAFRVIPQS